MKNFLIPIFIIFKKDIYEFFYSSLTYVLVALLTLITGWLFFNYLVQSKELTSLTIMQSVLAPFFGNVNFIFIFLAPLLTMNSFSLERHNGTLQLLFHSKLSLWQIILAKYCVLVVITLFMIFCSTFLLSLIVVQNYHDWGQLIVLYLGLFFSVGAYLAVGLFASSLFSHGLVSSLFSFSILLGSLMLVYSSQSIDNQMLADLIQYFSIPFHFEPFSRGLMKSYNGVFYLSYISFFLFMTHRVMEWRKSL